MNDLSVLFVEKNQKNRKSGLVERLRRLHGIALREILSVEEALVYAQNRETVKKAGDERTWRKG